MQNRSSFVPPKAREIFLFPWNSSVRHNRRTPSSSPKKKCHRQHRILWKRHLLKFERFAASRRLGFSPSFAEISFLGKRSSVVTGVVRSPKLSTTYASNRILQYQNHSSKSRIRTTLLPTETFSRCSSRHVDMANNIFHLIELPQCPTSCRIDGCVWKYLIA